MSVSEAAPRRGGNVAALGLAQLGRVVAGLAVNMMLMRSLGVEGFGVYGIVMNITGLLGFGAHLGMSRLLVREISRDPRLTGRMMATGLAATGLLSLLTGLAVVGCALLVDGRPLVVGAAALAALAMGLQALAMVPESAFHAISRMGPSSKAQLVGRMGLLVATALLLWSQLGVVGVFVAQIADGLLTLGLTALWYRRHFAGTRHETDRNAVQALVKEAWPFGLNAFFGAVYLSADVMMLGWMRGDAEVGIYRAAVMLLSLFPIIANTLTTGIYPRMARHLGDKDKAGEELGFTSRVLLVVSLPAAVGGMLTAEPLMVLLGGEDFARSALPFIVMAPLLPLRFVNNGFAMALSALNRQNDRTRGVFWAALLNVGVNLVAIPRFGLMGAAVTTLLTEVFLTAFFGWRVRSLVSGLGLGETLLRVSLPSAVMAGVLLLLPPMDVLVSIAVGALVFAGTGRLTGAWHRRDLFRLRRV